MYQFRYTTDVHAHHTIHEQCHFIFSFIFQDPGVNITTHSCFSILLICHWFSSLLILIPAYADYLHTAKLIHTWQRIPPLPTHMPTKSRRLTPHLPSAHTPLSRERERVCDTPHAHPDNKENKLMFWKNITI